MRILVTGGTGTLGRAFIEEYNKEHHMINFSRSEKGQKDMPGIEHYIGDVGDAHAIESAIRKSVPDAIVHCAAMKHIGLCEQHTTAAVRTNILGSLNVLIAGLSVCDVIVGVSTDKACEPYSTYGKTKLLMEKMYVENSNKFCKVGCVRFGNIANSTGSVLEIWKEAGKNNRNLRLTNPSMTRFFITRKEAAQAIYRQILGMLTSKTGGTVRIPIMKSVKMLTLAKAVAERYDPFPPKIHIVGAAPEESVHELLITREESRKVRRSESDLELVQEFVKKPFGKEISSFIARRMEGVEIEKLIDS
jgi:UDP-N-acetylglucosamine 4,6-dehydratase/5-epimerase